MADKFYEQVSDELAGETKQAAAVKTTEKAIAVPDAKAVPATPSITKPADATPASKEEGKIILTSVPEGADVYVDDSFVGNAPATLKLPAGKHPPLKFRKADTPHGGKRFPCSLARMSI